MNKCIESLAIFVVGLILLVCFVPGQEVLGFDARFYLFAREMWQQGLSWFPTTYGEPYPDYPAASTLLIYVAALFLGGVNKLAAVMPSAIAAAMTLSFTYLIGAEYARRWGWAAVFMLLLTLGFLNSAMGVSLDMYVVLLVTLSFYLVQKAYMRSQQASMILLLFLFALGFVFRGPLGLVMPTGVVCCYYVLQREYKRFLLVGSLSFAMLLVLMLALLSLAKHVGGEAFYADVLRMQLVGRMGEDAQPVYYYFTHGLSTYVLSYPVALLMLFGLLFAKLKRQTLEHGQALAMFVMWMLVIVLGMSIPGEKKIRYILPAMPACALLVAYLLSFKQQQQYLKLLRRILSGILLFLPAALLVVSLLVYVYADDYGLSVSLPYTAAFVSLGAIQVLSLVFAWKQIASADRWVVTAFWAALAFYLFSQTMAYPIRQYVERAHELVVAVEKQRVQVGAKLVFYKLHQDGLPIKYRMNMPKLEQPVFVEQLSELQKLSKPLFVVLRKKQYEREQAYFAKHYQMVASDRLGHVAIIILKSKGA